MSLINGKTGVTVYESSELLWAAINESVSTSTTITAGTGLSGGGNLGSDVTVRHDTITTNASSTTATTLAHGGVFSAITNVATDGMGHATGVTTTKFTLPSASDTAVTQTAESSTSTTPRPIVLKNGTGTGTVTGDVLFVTAATINGAGALSAASVSSQSFSGASFSGGSITVTGTAITA